MKIFQLARRNREDGNSAFQSGNHEIAILMYTEAMKYSPLNLAMGEGENMAISAANRLTFHLKYKVSCLDVVQLWGLVQGSPGSVQLKLKLISLFYSVVTVCHQGSKTSIKNPRKRLSYVRP